MAQWTRELIRAAVPLEPSGDRQLTRRGDCQWKGCGGMSAVGFPGAVGGYQVNFRVPPDTRKVKILDLYEI